MVLALCAVVLASRCVGASATWVAKVTGRRPGMDYLMRGYNLFRGNPAPTDRTTDPGFVHHVFQDTYTNKNTDATGRWQIPDGVDFTSCEGSCTMKTTVKVFDSFSRYVQNLRSMVHFDVSGFDSSFGASVDFERVNAGFHEEDKVYTDCKASCCSYTASIQRYNSPRLSTNFINGVRSLPTAYDQAAYFKFVDDFGTHHVDRAVMGGVFGIQTEFARQKFMEMDSVHNNWNVWAKAAFVVTVNAQTAGKSLNNQSTQWERWSKSERMYSVGQKPPTSWDPSDDPLAEQIAWSQGDFSGISPGSDGEPAPINTELIELSEVFSRQFFRHVDTITEGQLQDLEIKRANWKRAVGEYCEYRLLPEQDVPHCKMFRNDVNHGAPKTCLAATAAVGGTGGIPWDDWVNRSDHNAPGGRGLFQDVSLAGIKYNLGPLADGGPLQHISMFQFQLSSGDESWWLRPHGKGGGRDYSVTPLQSSINSVQVKLSYNKKAVDGMTLNLWSGGTQTIGKTGSDAFVDFFQEARKIQGTPPLRAWLVGTHGRAKKWIDSIGFLFAYVTAPGEECKGHAIEPDAILDGRASSATSPPTPPPTSRPATPPPTATPAATPSPAPMPSQPMPPWPPRYPTWPPMIDPTSSEPTRTAPSPPPPTPAMETLSPSPAPTEASDAEKTSVAPSASAPPNSIAGPATGRQADAPDDVEAEAAEATQTRSTRQPGAGAVSSTAAPSSAPGEEGVRTSRWSTQPLPAAATTSVAPASIATTEQPGGTTTALDTAAVVGVPSPDVGDPAEPASRSSFLGGSASSANTGIGDSVRLPSFISDIGIAAAILCVMALAVALVAGGAVLGVACAVRYTRRSVEDGDDRVPEAP